MTADKLVADMVFVPWYEIIYYLFFTPCVLIWTVLLIVIATVIALRRKKEVKSLADRIKMLFRIYYASIGIVGIAVALGGIVCICVSEIIPVIIFGVIQIVLGIFVVVISAILERRKHELIQTV
ncbi:MAG: hypothetical protein AB1485_06205 [Candidatus Thermoplasmatota archaeon]